MHCTRNVTDDVIWVGASDRRLALFENLFPIPRGVSYNSYLIADEKTCLLDTADSAVMRQFVENVEHALGGRDLDYLVVNHMEPDHCAAIEQVLLRHPEVKVVGNKKTFQMIGQFFELDLEGRSVEVAEGDTLELGRHTLSFHFAPMVHWPEVMVTYDACDKILFSADAFGTFGALNGNLFADEVDFEGEWLDDARRYYANIVGKYGPQVQNALKKLSGLDIQVICPLHGPVWRENLAWFLGKYDQWSRYEPEERTVAILYASMYGDLENAADILAAKLAERGVREIAMYDVSSTDVSELVAETWRCSHLALVSPTYNMGVYPAMANYLHDLAALNAQNRTMGIIGSGTWAPCSAKLVGGEVEGLKSMEVLEPVVNVLSSVKDEQVAQIEQLADAIATSLEA